MSGRYDLPPSLAVESDGPVRTVRLNRPDQLNAIDAGLPGRSRRCGARCPPTGTPGRVLALRDRAAAKAGGGPSGTEA